jgi:NADPH:quinone reductase
MRAVRVTRFGAPEVLVMEELDDPAAHGAGQVLVEVELAGVMFGDVIVRSGRFPWPLPWTPGLEVGGRVLAVGPGGDEALIGKTVVATTVGQSGGYAERALTTADYTFPVPDGLPLEVALTVFQAGAVARGLLTAMHLRSDDTVLITAAAGRVGSLLVQLAKAAGATVVGAAGADKTDAVRDFGADHVLDYTLPDWPERLRELTDGHGADLVLDAVGGDVTRQALVATADGGGRLGLYGYASGAWPELEIQTIARRGLTVSGPLGILTRKSDPEQRDDSLAVLAAAARGDLSPRIHARYPLAQAAQAHHELEQRRSIGAIVLSCL